MLAVGFAALGIFLVFQIVAPLLISTVLVRNQMETALEEWTGNDAVIGGLPTLRFWPQPRITLPDITIRQADGSQQRLLAHVGRISATFNLLEAVLGHPVFTDFRFTDPEVFVERDKDGSLGWSDSGLLYQAIDKASEGANGQSLAAALDRPIGRVQIRNGAITVIDQETGQRSVIRNVNGKVHWPYLSQPARIDGKAVIGGRQVNIGIDSSELLLLFAGKSSRTSGTVRADLFNASFNGVVNLAAHGYLSGDATFAASDMHALLTWLGRRFPGSDTIDSLSFKTKLITADEALRFEDLSLSINARQATGIVDLSFPPAKPPRLTGTLAVNAIDISYLLSQVAPRLLEESDPSAKPGGKFELDLRLSAQSARLGPFQLSEVAMGVMDVGNQARMDILDSDFEGGRLTGRIATIKEGKAGGVALRLSVHDTDFARIVSGLGLTGPLPAGKGSLELSLDAPRPLNANSWRTAKGSAHFVSDRGVISGMDLQGMLQMASQKPYFPLSAAGNGPFEYQDMDITAVLSDGTADIRNGHVSANLGRVTLNGIVPYINSSLALSASLSPIDTSGSPAAPVSFFVGGSWPDPIIWPIKQTEPKSDN